MKSSAVLSLSIVAVIAGVELLPVSITNLISDEKNFVKFGTSTQTLTCGCSRVGVKDLIVVQHAPEKYKIQPLCYYESVVTIPSAFHVHNLEKYVC